MLTFALVFLAHSIEISNYATKLRDFVEKNSSGLTIENIYKEFTELKHYHGNAIDALNPMFTTITGFGIANGYLLILYYIFFLKTYSFD